MVVVLAFQKIVAMKEKELSDLHQHVAHQSLKGQHIMKNYESDQVALLSHVCWLPLYFPFFSFLFFLLWLEQLITFWLQTLQKRESQIDALQAQLSQATKDLNETTFLIENMHRTSDL